MIQNSGASLLSIIHDILDFSKLESGGITIENRPFDVRDCVSQVTRILEPKALEKGIRLSARCDEACPDQVVGDAGRIRQVLMNLIGNAIKFTVEGHISVAVDSRSSGDDQVALCFSVRDTGIGIAPDQLERIFARFTQVDSSAARSYGGTGLGLAISRQLVEMMGGELTATGTEGDGSVFSYTLELARAEAQADAARAREPSSEPAPKAARFGAKVLVVEDISVNPLIASKLLEGLGCLVDVAANGIEGVEAIESRSYDLVFMDCQMPEMDGYEATRRIRAGAPEHRDVPVIALTANAMQGDRERCLAAGMDDYISKPIGKASVQAALSKWLPGKKLQDRDVPSAPARAGRSPWGASGVRARTPRSEA